MATTPRTAGCPGARPSWRMPRRPRPLSTSRCRRGEPISLRTWRLHLDLRCLLGRTSSALVGPTSCRGAGCRSTSVAAGRRALPSDRLAVVTRCRRGRGSAARRCGACSMSRAQASALTTLCGLVEPSDLVRMSWMPALSITARTGPPAITPVPAEAGLSSTRPAPKAPSDLVRDRGALDRHLDQVLLGDLDALADRHRHFLRLAGAVADAALAVADHHQRGEGEVLAALDHLGDAVDVDDLLDELALRRSRTSPRHDSAPSDRRVLAAQNSRPLARAASASALTLPW